MVLVHYDRSVAAPTAAPVLEGDGEQQLPRRERPATSRPFWWLLLLALALVSVARAPGILRYITAAVPPEMSAEIDDPELLSLALEVGTWLAVVGYVMAIAIYLSLASALEKRVFPGRLGVGRDRSVGLFFLTALAATLPVQLHALASGLARPEKDLFHLTYLLALAALLPWLFRAGLRELPVKRRRLVVATVWFMLALIGIA